MTNDPSTPAPTPPKVTARQIADLLAWARSLSEHPPQIDDPDERAAFLKDKIELLGRIAEDNVSDSAESGPTRKGGA